MKSRKQRILSVMLALVVLAGCLAPSVDVKASGRSETRGIRRDKSVTIRVGAYYETCAYTQTTKNKIKGCKVSIGNKKILSHVNTTSGGPVVYGLKKGSTKLTVRFKEKGRWKKYSTKVKVVAYKNPIKSLKIGSQTLTSKVKKATDEWYNYTPKAKSEKISVKAASGWKVKSISHNDKKIKNNQMITYVGIYDFISIELYNKKTKQYEFMQFGVNYNF